MSPNSHKILLFIVNAARIYIYRRQHSYFIDKNIKNIKNIKHKNIKNKK